MIGQKPKGIRAHLTLAYPALMLGTFFIVPFCLMAAVSFFHRQPGGFYVTGFELTNYKNLYTNLFGRTLVFSLFVAGLSAAVCVSAPSARIARSKLERMSSSSSTMRTVVS